MKFSLQQLLIIIFSAVLLTLAVLRLSLGVRDGWGIAIACLLILSALCGIYGAYKLDKLGLLIFCIACVVVAAVDVVNLVLGVARTAHWQPHLEFFFTVAEIVVFVAAAVIAWRLRRGTVGYYLRL